MKIKKTFLRLLSEKNITIALLAKKLGIHPYIIVLALNGYINFDYEETKELISIFGADEIAKVVDWEGMNVCCPI